MRRLRISAPVPVLLALSLPALPAALPAALLAARSAGGGERPAEGGAPPIVPRGERPASPRPGGVGVAAGAVLELAALCRDCHPSETEGYLATGMARALGPLVPGELAGLQEVLERPTGYRYRLEEGEGAAPRIVESWRPPGAGGPLGEVRRSARLVFAVGAGRLDRSYVAEVGGRWWFAPLEVLLAGEGESRQAALAPGHRIAPGTRLRNPIAEECLACHTDALAPRGVPANLAPPPEAGWAPAGITCAACHGDARGHAEDRERELAGETVEGEDPILGGRDLALAGRLSLCARCHLQGDARIALAPGERGIPPPGEDFLARWAIFLPAASDDLVAFVSQTERMVASPCFTGSVGGERELTCTSCHDPHRPLDEPRERERVRAGCHGCHAQAGGVGDDRGGCALAMGERAGRDCVSCHMRRTPVFDVEHVRIHDHRIVRRPPPAEEVRPIRVKHTTDGALAAFAWPGLPAPPYARDPALLMMAEAIAGFPARAARRVDAEPSPRVARLETYHHLRAVLLEGLGRDAEAAAAYRRALARDPESAESALNLALVLGRLGRAEEGIETLDRLLARHPRHEGAWRNRALLRLGQGDAEGFRRNLEAAQHLLPRAANARALAGLAEARGDAPAAERWRAEAARLAPHEASPPHPR